MYLLQPERHSRRAFLRRSGQLALTGTALPFALNLAAMGEAAAFTATDYKALVCVFLFGGNDYANTVLTYDDASYNAYNTIRGGGAGQAAGGIALAKAALAPTLLNPAAALPGGRQYALHPAMSGLAGLFNSGKAAVQLNVGPLVVPLTKAQYNSADRKTYPLPPKLFSHNDQQSVWQSSSPEGSTVGWGGNIGDLALSSNTNSLFTCISVAGNAVFMSGDSALQYQVSTGGAVKINGVASNVYGSAAVKNALATLIQEPRAQVLENEYNKVTARAVTAEAQVSAGLAGVALATAFPSGNPLADQLKMVARLIGARSTLGAKRQVFFVSLGGFDLHDNLISQQPTLLARLSDAMTAFYNATAELGVADKVTAFTASDFGRTLSSNGDGSDHGWGSHHFMVGGAVKGQAFYGTAPPVSVGSTAAPEDQWHVGQGRLLPSTSVDQYAATLAQWFGVADGELAGILPNIGHFGTAAGRPDYPVNLGFMR
ncbi:MAG TPA: DUF1501 domain-containing protein [Burkholderiaceae bacterium]|nr:DUF1501 domain-containing protein [Burkholderiaceae bacterium]